MKQNHNNVKATVTAALFAAIACVATMSIRIPTPGTGGYIHPGDAVVVLCGIFLAPGPAFLAAGIGSAMADLFGGYFLYVPITLIIKGTSACLGSYLYRRFLSKKRPATVAVMLCGVLNMAAVAGGYYLCETVLYGMYAAALNIPANLVQGAAGLLISLLLYPMLKHRLST